MIEAHHDTHRCPHCGADTGPRPRPGLSLDWRRSTYDRRIAGVCGGLAQEFGIPAALLRLGFVLATLFAGGVGLVIYAALWVIMAPDVHERGVVHRHGDPNGPSGDLPAESPR